MVRTQMRAVRSSAVLAIGYDEDAQEAYVRFASGATYAYGAVTPKLWGYFEASESKGRFVNLILKPRHPCRQV